MRQASRVGPLIRQLRESSRPGTISKAGLVDRASIGRQDQTVPGGGPDRTIELVNRRSAKDLADAAPNGGDLDPNTLERTLTGDVPELPPDGAGGPAGRRVAPGGVSVTGAEWVRRKLPDNTSDVV